MIVSGNASHSQVQDGGLSSALQSAHAGASGRRNPVQRLRSNRPVPLRHGRQAEPDGERTSDRSSYVNGDEIAVDADEPGAPAGV